MSETSDTLLQQRLRSRIIESLEAFVEGDSVGLIGTDEIIEGWYDWVNDDCFDFFDAPVFNVEELNAIKRFHNLLESTYEKVPTTWKLAELRDCKEWSVLVSAAREEVLVFKKRGRLDEDREIT